jgi:hypothetical protein
VKRGLVKQCIGWNWYSIPANKKEGKEGKKMDK